MIDFIKIVIYDPKQIEIIWNNPILDFLEEKDRRVSSGKIKPFDKLSYRNLIFEKRFDKNNTLRLEISGSIHTFWNIGIHNADDFSFLDVILTINKFKELFNIDLNLCKVVNLEYGLNLMPEADIKDIIIWLKYHNRNEFRFLKDVKHAKQSGSFNKHSKLNHYKVIKAYAKGLQLFNGKYYGHENTFRFEVRSQESKYINSLGIYTLNDLTKEETYITLANELLKEWENVLILDKSFSLLNDPELNKYLSSDFWENSIYNKCRNYFAIHKRKYLSILEKYPDNIFEEIRNLIISKLKSFEDELFGVQIPLI